MASKTQQTEEDPTALALKALQSSNKEGSIIGAAAAFAIALGKPSLREGSSDLRQMDKMQLDAYMERFSYAYDQLKNMTW